MHLIPDFFDFADNTLFVQLFVTPIAENPAVPTLELFVSVVYRFNFLRLVFDYVAHRHLGRPFAVTDPKR